MVSASQSRSVPGGEQPVAGGGRPEAALCVAGGFASCLRRGGDLRLVGCGFGGDGQQGGDAGHHAGDAAGGHGDPFLHGGSGHGPAGPLPAGHVDRCGVADQGDVNRPFQQRGLGAEPHVHGARRHAGGLGHRGQGGRGVAIPDEQPCRGGNQPLLGVRDTAGALLGGAGVDTSGHAMQYNCITVRLH